MSIIKINTGIIGKSDWLYGYLSCRDILKKAGMECSPSLLVERLNGSHEIFSIRDARGAGVILKSYNGEDGGRAKKEFMRLRRARHAAGTGQYYDTVRPLMLDHEGSIIIQEYVKGKSLGYYMSSAFMEGEERPLYDKLSMVAGYLFRLHDSGRRDKRLDPRIPIKNLLKHSSQAAASGAISGDMRDQIKSLSRDWQRALERWAPKKVLVHGDVTPANFLFNGKKMYAIDLERSGYKDPAHDLGMLAGELFHYAFMLTGNAYRADPFIGHLYRMYSGNFMRRDDVFLSITGRNPLYMANSLLRIARNRLADGYRRALGYYALECLKSLKKYSPG